MDENVTLALVAEQSAKHAGSFLQKFNKRQLAVTSSPTPRNLPQEARMWVPKP